MSDPNRVETQPAPSHAVPPPHIQAIISLISTLAVIELADDTNASEDSRLVAAKKLSHKTLNSARDLSPELRPLIDGIRERLK